MILSIKSPLAITNPAVNHENHPIFFNSFLHEYGRDVEHAWSQSSQEGDWMEDSEEDTEEDTQEEMEDTEDRGAPK